MAIPNQPQNVVVGPSGDSVLAFRQGNAWQIEAHGPDLQVKWKRDLSAQSEVPLLALDGDTLHIASGRSSLEPDDRISLARLAMASGALLDSRQVAEGATPQSLIALADHTLVLAGRPWSGAQVGDTRLTTQSPEGALLMQLSPEGDPLWATLFCDNGGSDYGYYGAVRLRYSQNTLHALLTDANLELGPGVVSTGANTTLLHFELPLADTQAGAGGASP